MFKNYFKIALRNLARQKGYSFINITGLAIGMACAIFILLWVQDELNFDGFHENKDNIFRVRHFSKMRGMKFMVLIHPVLLPRFLKIITQKYRSRPPLTLAG
jgi:putative ABC transport system permease protein